MHPVLILLLASETAVSKAASSGLQQPAEVTASLIQRGRKMLLGKKLTLTHAAWISYPGELCDLLPQDRTQGQITVIL